MSSIKVCLPSKVVFLRRLSSIKGHLPSNVVFHQRSFSINGHLSSKVVFLLRWSSTKGHLPSKVVFCEVKSMCKIPDLKFTCLWQISVRVLVVVGGVVVLLTRG